MIAEVIRPSVLNAIIVFAMVVVVGSLWRMAAAYFSDSSIGQSMSVAY